MKFSKDTAEVFVPDGLPVEQAIARTTQMGIGAHQDDLEIMCVQGVLDCFSQADQWFCGVNMTDGAGSARDDLYAKYTNEQMVEVRRHEQKKAAYVGEYGAQAFLNFTSNEVRDPANTAPKDDLQALIAAAKPEIIYTHNLADKHSTHIGVVMNVLRALRALPKDQRPKKLYGCEVWRDLDWMLDEDKSIFKLDKHPNIALSLLGIFDSQIVGGKRYDLATVGRRRANATYHEPRRIDASQMINLAMDLTPLIQDDSLDIQAFVLAHIDRFRQSVVDNLAKFV